MTQGARDGALLAIRRARTQGWLLAAVLALIVVGATLLGACAQLLTAGQDRARAAALAQLPADQLTIEVVLSNLSGDAGGAVADAQEVLAAAVDPLPASTSTWVTSTVRPLTVGPDGVLRLGYLAGIEDISDCARLDVGRWPSESPPGTPWETALPTVAAQRLGVGPGDQLQLAGSDRPIGSDDSEPVSVVVVGTFTPMLSDGTWLRDELGGAGWAPRLDYGPWKRVGAPVSGPFVVPEEALLAGSELARVSVLSRPDVATASPRALDRMAEGLGGTRRALSAALGDRNGTGRLDSPLAATLADVATRQAVTSSTVLVASLLGTLLTATALTAAARLLAGRRAAETALMGARGATRRRIVLPAAVEAMSLGLIGGAVALPLTVWADSAMVQLPGGGALSATAVGTIAGAGLLAATVLVLPTIRTVTGAPPGRRSARGAVIRSGLDLLLLGMASVAFLQLRKQPAATSVGIDPVLVAAPVACLLAGAVLAMRVVPLTSAVAEMISSRSRGAVLALSAWGVARRPNALGALFLLVLATSTATSGLAIVETWRASQGDQADLRAGTDLAVPAAVDAPLDQGEIVAAATGGTVTPVTAAPVSLGSVIRTGTSDVPTRLVAVDTTGADAVLRGRLPAGGSWSAITHGLAPHTPLGGLRLPAVAGGPGITVTGSADIVAFRARPVLLVVDEFGSRTALAGESVLLDGQPHLVVVRDPAGGIPTAGLTIVGLDLDVEPLDRAAIDFEETRTAAVRIEVDLFGAAVGGDGASEWAVEAPLAEPGTVDRPTAEVVDTATGARVTVSAEVSLVSFVWQHPLRLVVTAYERPASVPVLVTTELAAALGAAGKDAGLSMTVAGTTVTARVVGVVPYLPSVPTGPGVLADVDALTRALSAAGDTSVLTAFWWVGGVVDPLTAGDRLAESGLPGAVSRTALTAELHDSPLAVGVPAALRLLVVAAGLLAVLGTLLHAVAVLGSRAPEVARLQGLGMPRRSVTAALMSEHTALTSLGVGLGALLGALAAGLLAPLMTVSDTGAVPAPTPVPAWPWSSWSVAVAVLLVSCAVVAVPVATAVVRRADAVHLRMDGGGG